MAQSQNIYNPAQSVTKTRIINLERGMLPPQAPDLEEAVLGAMMIDEKGVDECMMVIKSPDVFFKEANRAIFEAITALYAEAQAVDILTVSARLRAMGKLEVAGGDFNLIQLSQKISGSAHIEFHSRVLLQSYIKRQVIKTSSSLMSRAYDEDKDSIELLEEWGNELDLVNEMTMSGQHQLTYKAGLEQVQKRIEFLTNKKTDEITGARTGFAVEDRFTNGYHAGELIIIAGRPGMGKTSYILKCAVENAKHGDGVGIISAEMSAYSLIARTVAIDTNFHLKQITKTGFEKSEYFGTLANHVHRMNAYPIVIDDTASPDIRHVISQARMMKRKHDIKILLIDYLQLVTDVSKGGNREQEIASITRRLKGLAKELDIPVIALSQLSRKVEERPDRRPKLSDLRESGAIEQDADIVKFIYRAEYYGLSVSEDIERKGANTEVIYAKYRNGAPDMDIGLWWQGDKTKFMDPEEHMRQVEEDYAQAQHYDAKALPAVNAQDAFGYIQTVDKDDVPF